MVNRILPKVDLADVLIEVDGWTHFSDCFKHQANIQPRTETLLFHIYASIMAQALNFGLHQMEDITIFYRKLSWCTTWYIRDETSKSGQYQSCQLSTPVTVVKAMGWKADFPGKGEW